MCNSLSTSSVIADSPVGRGTRQDYVGLVDINAFFVSAERVFDPLVVGSSGGGVVE